MRAARSRASLAIAVSIEEKSRRAEQPEASVALTSGGTPWTAPLTRVSATTWAIGGGTLGALVLLVLFVSALCGTRPRTAENGEAGLTQLTSEEDAGMNVKGPTGLDEKIVD